MASIEARPATDPTVASTSAGSTALAALYKGAGERLELVEALVPAPGLGEVLVRVECCAVCSSDLHTHAGRRSEPTPTVLGHEIVGRIVSFGENAARVDARGVSLYPGDRITWTVAASCGVCENCRDGLDQKCAKLVKYGHERVTREMPFRGGLAEVVLLSPGTGMVKLPGEISGEVTLEVLTLANCSTATVAAVLRAGFARRNRQGMAVAVIGAGVLGLTACAMARSTYRCSVVIACDRDPSRAELAKAFGATHYCSDLAELGALSTNVTNGQGVDVAVELAGSHATAEAAMGVVRTGGTVVLAGTTLPTQPLVIEPQAIVRRLLRIEGVHNYVVADLIAAVDFLLGDGRGFPFSQLIDSRYALTEVHQAFERGHVCGGRRVVVVP